MKIISKAGFIVLLAVFFAVPLAVSNIAHAEDEHEATPETQEEAQDKQPQEEAPKQEEPETVPQVIPLGTYQYVAQPGDSYTVLARKAVQTYGKKFDIKLSLAGIVFAETNLTQAAGSPDLAVGQEVEIDEAQVKDWAERASALSDEEEAAWDYYVQFIDSFNTDHAGQSQ